MDRRKFLSGVAGVALAPAAGVAASQAVAEKIPSVAPISMTQVEAFIYIDGHSANGARVRVWTKQIVFAECLSPGYAIVDGYGMDSNRANAKTEHPHLSGDVWGAFGKLYCVKNYGSSLFVVNGAGAEQDDLATLLRLGFTEVLPDENGKFWV